MERGGAVAGRELPDVLRFMQLLWGVAHGLERASKRMRQQVGVTGPQRLVLRVVGLFPGLSAGELAAILHLHPSTLTGVLQRLAAQGLLARMPDPGDRRRAVLRLTPSGARVNSTGRGTVEAEVAVALGELGDRDRASAVRALARLAEHLSQEPAARGKTGGPNRLQAAAAGTVPSRSRSASAQAGRGAESRRAAGDRAAAGWPARKVPRG